LLRNPGLLSNEVRQVPLQQVEALIDALDKPEFHGQQVDGPDAARCDGTYLLGDPVADVGGGHHGPMAFHAGLILDSAEDVPLEAIQLAMDTGVHSKASWVANG
jgi:hypothetical protein